MKNRFITILVIGIVIMFLIFFIISFTSMNKRVEKPIAVEVENRKNTTTEVIIEEYDISNSQNDNVKANLYEDGTLVVYGTGDMKPSPNWGNNSIINIKIENGVTNISKEAFAGLNKLENVEVSSTVKEIYEYAFYDCGNLRKVIIPSSVEHIYENAFDNCYYVDIYCNSNTGAEHFVEYAINYGFDQAYKRLSQMMNSGDFDVAGGVQYVGYGQYIIKCGIIDEESEDIHWIHETYRHINGLEKKIDDNAPIINEIVTNPSDWTTNNVILSINSDDESVGLDERPYSFDGGVNWQSENEKIYTENTSNIVIKVKDKLGNIETKEGINITNIDKVNPTITQISGNQTNWTKENVLLTVNANDELSGISEYSFDGGKTWQKENTKTYTENINGIVIQVRDNAGNITTGNTINITKIDKDTPQITSIIGNPTEWTTENVTLIVEANDILSGLAPEAYSFDGGKTWQKENTKMYTENINGIIIQVRDNSGNIITANTVNITKIDKDTPQITSITGNSTEWTTEDVTLIVEANDALSGLAPEAYSFDGGKTWQKENTKTYTENINGIIIQIRDNVGNIAVANPINIDKIRKITEFSINTLPNKIEYTIGENLDTQGLTLKVNYSNGDSEIITQGFTCSPTICDMIGIQKITVTYLGKTTTFNVKVTTDDEESDEIILNSNKYNIKDYIIKNIQPKTILSNFKQNITTNATIIKVFNNTTELLNNDIIGTGLQLFLDNKISYTLVVKGDCTGDGQVNIQDILSINKHRLEKVELKDEYLIASDVNEDGKVDIRDILQINKYRLNKINEL